MFKRVDIALEPLEGFSYNNKCGNLEKVVILHSTVKIEPTGGYSCEVYYEDVPRLILALQAAYDYNQGK